MQINQSQLVVSSPNNFILPETSKKIELEPVIGSEFNFDKNDLAPLREFLRGQREKLHNAMTQPSETMPEVHVVMGNESGDLDSIISSIVRAYHLSLTQEGENAIYIPYINIFREEFGLRKDALYLFENFGISTNDISFIDDKVSLDAIHQKNKLKLHLVDHNELNPDQEHLAGTVVDIIDHHVDSKKYPELQQKQIEVIGSCTTLVANELLKTMPIEKMPKAMAGLLLAPVLIDTENLGSKDKTTQKDIELKETLCTKLGEDLSAPGYYEKIKTKKTDTTGIPNKLLLLKDFKKFKADDVVYGMSSLVSSEGSWIENAQELLADVEDVAKTRGLSFLVLLMPGAGKLPERKMVVYSKSPEILEEFNKQAKANEFLKNVGLVQEQPQENNNSSASNINFYRTKEFVSRKTLQPAIQDISKNETFVATFKAAKEKEQVKTIENVAQKARQRRKDRPKRIQESVMELRTQPRINYKESLRGCQGKREMGPPRQRKKIAQLIG